jgi:hypothetical protein
MTTAVVTGHADVWTDHAGNVHSRRPDEHTVTRCGLNAGASNKVRSPRACRDCIELQLSDEQGS